MLAHTDVFNDTINITDAWEDLNITCRKVFINSTILVIHVVINLKYIHMPGLWYLKCLKWLHQALVCLHVCSL